MDKQRAKLMLEETFRNRFDNNNFIQFIKELFNKFEDCKKECGREEIPKDFQDYIDSYSLFGKYEDSEGKSIDVLAVKLKKNNPESARTMQRNFIAKHLAQRNINAALVAFYGEDIDNWRFSFVKLEYHLEKDEQGNIKPVTTLTPPKRYSFLVGKTEPSHTAQSRFLELLIKEDTNPMVSEIESSFSVEKVTKEFFEKYKGLYDKLEKTISKTIKNDKVLNKEFKEKGISTEDFAKKLLGQIVFLYFLQKKGWLGVQESKEWGEGDKKFLRNLFDKCILEKGNFFNDYLQILFYNTLNNPRSNQTDPTYSKDFECKIPFLNGGLFEPIGGYNWENTRLELENNLFNGILEVFDTYNFTVKEDEPLEKEVAIDPEMLGKVFENLLEIKDRKSTGSYYTPREIVHYMCQESLINYLETGTGIDKKHIENLIHNGEISNKIKEDYERIDGLLKDIKVVDPAIGSGAFPVGMMMEIIKARSALTDFFPIKEQSERTAYNFKRECIENSLYGVDIDPSAVDIAQLRLWLSLIVDETDIHKIKPLPNLDYKIMCGNSLLEEFEGVKLFDEKLLGEVKRDYLQEMLNINKRISELIRNKANEKEIKKLQKEYKALEKESKKDDSKQSILSEDTRVKESQKKLKELKELHEKFLNENNRRKKNELRKEIEKLDWGFIETTLKEEGNEEARKKLETIKRQRSRPFFLWKLYFAEVFQEKGGFDVCIANPPYFPITNLPPETKDVLFNNNQELLDGEFVGKIDVYAFFIMKSLKHLLRPRGYMNYIMPKTILSNLSFSKLREIIINRYEIEKIVDLEKVFEQVTGTMTYLLLFIKKVNPNKPYSLEVDSMNLGGAITYSSVDISNLERPPLYIWVLSKRKLEILNKIEKNSRLLKEDFITKNGVCTGKNSKFISKKKENDYYKKIFVAKDIDRYEINSPNNYVYYKPEVLHRAREEWIFKGPKIVSQMIRGLNTTRSLICALDNSDDLVLNSINIIRKKNNLSNLEFVLGILNSKLMNFYFKTLIIDVNIKTVYLDLLPIRYDNKKIIDKIVDLVKKMMNRKVFDNVLSDKIDQLVYELYGLTKEEIEIVENFNKK